MIDQHNFRAMNYYFHVLRPAWHTKRKPSSYGDLELLSTFLAAIECSWRTIEPSTTPCRRDLDRFLMMYGKALKSRKALSPPTIREGSEDPVSQKGGSRGDSNLKIRLPFGGLEAAFDPRTLLQYVKESGRAYIIQGQAQCKLAVHPKPLSLDFWLRKNFAQNPDTKQAVNSVIHELVSTGLFEEGNFSCPDSGRLCKGVQIAQAG